MAPIHLFTLAGVRVRTSLGFLLLLAYFGYLHQSAGPIGILLTVVTVILTLLIHEFGHAMIARHYGLQPHILLHGWGGLCFHEPAREPRHDALIILGGPLTQIAFAGLVYVVAELAGPITSPYLAYFIHIFVLYSIFWGLLNLIPIFPLDGGQLLRIGLQRFVKPQARAERLVFQIGIGLSVGVAAIGFLVLSAPILGLFGVLWAFENNRYLQHGKATAPPKPRRNAIADSLLDKSLSAFQAADFHEARRLAFQARAEKGLQQDQLDQALRVITVASAELKDWEEALDWSLRAPRTPDVFAARLMALAGRGRLETARAEYRAEDAPELPPFLAGRVRRALDLLH